MDAGDGLLHNTDDGGLGFANENPAKYQHRLRHPIAALFHVGFQFFALLIYLFCGWFSSGFVFNFVIIVLLLSANFWTVKNVTGRLLAGLRWWNYIDQEGKSHWVFEARKDKTQIGVADSQIFWLSLFVFFILWLIFSFVTLVGANLKWFMVALIGLSLNGANLYGYLRCRIGRKESLSAAASNFLQQQVVKNVVGSFGGPQQQPNSSTINTV